MPCAPACRQARQAPFQRGDLLLGQLRHLGVGGLGEEFAGALEFSLDRANLAPRLHGSGQRRAFPAEFTQPVQVAYHIRVRELPLHGAEAFLGLGDVLCQSRVDHGLHGPG